MYGIGVPLRVPVAIGVRDGRGPVRRLQLAAGSHSIQPSHVVRIDKLKPVAGPDP